MEKLLWRKNILPDAISAGSILHSVSFLGKVRKAAVWQLPCVAIWKLNLKTLIYQRYCINAWKLLWQQCLRKGREMLNVIQVPAGSVPSAGLGSARWLTSNWILEAFLFTVRSEIHSQLVVCTFSIHRSCCTWVFGTWKQDLYWWWCQGASGNGGLLVTSCSTARRRLSFCFNELCFVSFSYLQRKKKRIYAVCCDISLWWDW